MKKAGNGTGARTLDGTVWNFLGDSLALPLGFLVVVYLTRRLGAGGYGLYAIVGGLILWVEWSVVGLFSRATIRLVGDADDWRPIGAALTRLYLLSGMGVGAFLWIMATPISLLMHEPLMTGYLRLFALDIPLFTLAQAHKNLLVGTGMFRPRALATAGRWVSRLLLIVLLVEAGFSLYGAILGNIAASVVELAICRCYIRPALLSAPAYPSRLFWSYAIPLFLSGMSMSLFNKIDLFALKALGGSAAEAGVYGAAQNLSLIPGVFALSFSSLILSSLSRMLRDGEEADAKAMAENSLRVIILLLPFAGITIGASGEILRVLFGPGYAAASLPLSLLFFAAIAQSMITVVTVIMAAQGKPGWTFMITGPLVPLALVGHMLLIPRMGSVGAALITALFSLSGAVAVSLATCRRWRVMPPPGTLARSCLLAFLAYAASAAWPAQGVAVPLKLTVLALAVLPGFWLLREFDSKDMALVGEFLALRGRRR
jgi:O-antigen/teichoic acid export membrane protein